MSYEDYLVAIGEAPVNNATEAATVATTATTATPEAVVKNLVQVAEVAASSVKEGTSAAETASFKAIEDAANAEYQRTVTAARAADLAASGSSVNTDIARGPLMGPSRFSTDGRPLEFKPITEGARLAIFGYNPKTGKVYTDEESAALNGGYIPEGYRDIRGYRFDPVTGELEILNAAGMTAGLGARYQMNAKGNLVARPGLLPKGVGQDEDGRYYQPGERMPGETTAQFIGRLSQLGQGVIFENGKAIQYDASGRFYTEGQPVPQDFGQVQSGNQTTGNLGTTAVTSRAMVTGTSASNIKPIPTGVTVTTTYTDPKTGDTVGVLSNGTTQVLAAGDKIATGRASTIATLVDRFNKYGLGSLANKIQELAIDGATESTITLQLQETPEYQTRFSANNARIKQGLQVLNPAEYLSLEDGYRQVLRAYGLRQFDTDAYVQQFIANDVSAAELSNRVVTAVQRVQNADPAISRQLREFYGVGQEDLVAYVLDPQQQFQKIQRQVAAAEIGVAAGRQGLRPGVAVAEQLAAQGVTQAEAQKGYATIADILPTAEKLSDIYGTTLDTYGQSEAEQEVFNSLASAQRKRERLTARELGAFSGSSGTNKTSLTTSNVGQF
jgi:hypothetical protein